MNNLYIINALIKVTRIVTFCSSGTRSQNWYLEDYTNHYSEVNETWVSRLSSKLHFVNGKSQSNEKHILSTKTKSAHKNVNLLQG